MDVTRDVPRTTRPMSVVDGFEGNPDDGRGGCQGRGGPVSGEVGVDSCPSGLPDVSSSSTQGLLTNLLGSPPTTIPDHHPDCFVQDTFPDPPPQSTWIEFFRP